MTRIAAPAEGPSADHPRHAAPRASLVIASALFLCGCGGGSSISLPAQALHPVKGSVVTADGKPVTEGDVAFIPVKMESRGAVGKIQPDGTFAMKCGAEDGCPEGEFKVAIRSDATVPGSRPVKPVVPVAYQDEDSSGLVVTVKSGTNDLPPFKLVPVKAKPGGASGNRRD